MSWSGYPARVCRWSSKCRSTSFPDKSLADDRLERNADAAFTESVKWTVVNFPFLGQPVIRLIIWYFILSRIELQLLIDFWQATICVSWRGMQGCPQGTCLGLAGLVGGATFAYLNINHSLFLSGPWTSSAVCFPMFHVAFHYCNNTSIRPSSLALLLSSGRCMHRVSLFCMFRWTFRCSCSVSDIPAACIRFVSRFLLTIPETPSQWTRDRCHILYSSACHSAISLTPTALSHVGLGTTSILPVRLLPCHCRQSRWEPWTFCRIPERHLQSQ